MSGTALLADRFPGLTLPVRTRSLPRQPTGWQRAR